MKRSAILALALHLAVLAGLVIRFQQKPTPADLADAKGAVELMLVEQPTVVAPQVPAPPAVPPVPDAPEVPPPPAAAAATESLPLPPPPTPPPNEPERAEVPPVRPTPDAPKITIAGTDSETFAIARGSLVVPASVDAKFRNRQPVYPMEAVRRAQEGVVLLLIRVSSEGLPIGVDVAKSSGYALLDGAARDAVLGWHFLPAVKDGRPIPFEMIMQVGFHLD
jgi:protein TonB